MVKLTFQRAHVSGHVSVGSTVFISRDKAIAAIASWQSDVWTYTIVSIERVAPPKAGSVTYAGQII